MCEHFLTTNKRLASNDDHFPAQFLTCNMKWLGNYYHSENLSKDQYAAITNAKIKHLEKSQKNQIVGLILLSRYFVYLNISYYNQSKFCNYIFILDQCDHALVKKLKRNHTEQSKT